MIEETDDLTGQFRENEQIKMDVDRRLLENDTVFAAGKRFNLDDLFLESGYGPLRSAITALFYGINHRGFGNPAPVNRDNAGMVFFTRPRMCLNRENLAASREFSPLANKNKLSVHRAVRAWLDPIGSGSTSRFTHSIARTTKTGFTDPYNTPLVDPLNPFITILGNTCTSLTGWPDIDIGTFTSAEGLYREMWSMPDGIAHHYGTFNLNATFQNMHGDPLGILFFYWILYMELVYDGTIIPYMDSILENEKDYETRIYRLVLDPSRTYVQKIAACGAAFPTTSNVGANFNYNPQSPYQKEVDEVSISFQCQGAIYYDPILCVTFNETVQMTNLNMMDGKREKTYVKLKPMERELFHCSGYPRIDPWTMELEWWVPREDYNARMKLNPGATL